MAKYKQGFYTPLNPHKYIQPTDRTMNKHPIPEFRSSWERKFMVFCDHNPSIKYWGTECFAIPYFDPVQNKKRRYFIDGYIEFTDGSKFLVEIKPSSEVKSPKVPKSQTPKAMYNYQKACRTFATNCAKWGAARLFAAEKGLKFIILTEKELGV